MKKLFGIVGLCAVLGTASGADSDGLELLYQRALHLETAKADYDGAIPIYATILSQHAQNAAIAAKALFRQGVCYEKTGKLDLARECARKLGGEFQAIAKADPEMAKWTERIGGLGEGQPGNRGLSNIQLPEQPSRAQVKAYIAAVVQSSKGQNSFGPDYPEVKKLKKVGSQHVDLLIEARDPHDEDYHLAYAIVALADESSKKVVLENLEGYPALAEVVLNRGWAQDAREILVRRLRKDPGYLPLVWVQAVAELNDPGAYPLIRKYFIRGHMYGSERSEAHEILKKLPIEDLPGAVSEAWAVRRTDPVRKGSGEKLRMACIAVDYGHLDALETLFDEIAKFNANNANRRDQHEAEEIRIAIARCTGLTGDEEKMVQWWRENRGALRFDPETKKFAPSKNEAAPQRPANGAAQAQ
jgi:hypothetical protein